MSKLPELLTRFVTTMLVPCLTLTLFVLAPAIAQETTQSDHGNRDRVSDQRVDQQRPGGIPRSQVEQQQTDKTQATEEGMPAIEQRQRERDPGIQRDETYTQPGQPRVLVRPRHEPGWKLGVYAYNTDTGVVITQVVANSAASRAGLESGDRIVAVDGFQIGWVLDRLYPLGEELQRQADRSGKVRLLLQNVRNNELLVRDVYLTGTDHRHRAARPNYERSR